MHRVSNKFNGISNPKPSCDSRCMRGTGPRAMGKRGLNHARFQSAPTGGTGPALRSNGVSGACGGQAPALRPMKFEPCALSKRAYGRDGSPRYVQTKPPVHAGDRPPRYGQTRLEPCALTKRAYGSGPALRFNAASVHAGDRPPRYVQKCTADVLERFAPIRNNETATLPSRARLNWTAPPLRLHRRPDVIGTTGGERGCV